MDKLNSDLVVAVLAVLTDVIPQSALAQAVKTWTEQPGQSLTQWLKHSAGLDDAHIRALECLAAAHLKAHQNDLRDSLTAWNAFELTQDVLTEINDDSLRTTLGASLGNSKTVPLGTVSSGSSLAGALHPLPRTAEAERFHLIRPHAKGGIGQVWVARDSELQRDVALKEIQPQYAESASQRIRFVREAEITGNLEHPGIVPVYSLGRNAEGRPYYAMRFIQGESFSAAIRQFHKARREQVEAAPASPRPTWGIEFRQLLQRFLDVCDAIDYAHSRGVLHRDLKPANIMLGRYGETLVVDWGLAKVMGKNEANPEREEGDFEPGFVGASAATSGETVEGTTIGTPSYMSPEQARGAIDQLGPCSDVFSLGATLYELLTGRVPFPGERVKEIIEKVLKGDLERPRALDRSIPAPLEAVCLKALASEPAERYPSVRALAQDLEHWLADEPVTAYPERRLERAGRWVRQHRTWAYAAVAALVGISLAASIGVFVVDGARRREAAVREEAEKNFTMAQAAVEDYLTSVSENTLFKQQDSVDIRTLRQELLNNALTYYQRFVKQRGKDSRLRRQLANAYSRVGAITAVIGSASDAIEAFQAAQNLWEPLAAAEPANHELQSRLADCHLAIGRLQSSTGDVQAALNSLNQARDLLAPLAKEHPEVPAYTESLAACYLRIGLVQSDRKALDEALAALEQAKTIQERLIARAQGRPADEQMLAEIILGMGNVYYEMKDNPAALRSFQEVQRICQALLDRIAVGPKPVRLLDLLAISHYDSATIEKDTGRLDEALQSFERSLGYRTLLADAHPSVNQYHELLGKNLAELANLQHEARQNDKAFASIKKSIDVLDKLVKSQPDRPVYHHDLGRSWNIQGYFYDVARQNSAAIQALNRAIAEARRAVAAAPEVDLYKSELCNQLDNLGEQYVDLGEVSEGLNHYREETEILRKLMVARPENQDYAVAAAEALRKLGNIQRHDGDLVSAEGSLAKARAALEPFAAATSETRGRLGVILSQEAAVLADLKKTTEALALLERAVNIFVPLSAASPTDDIARVRLSESLWELARVLRAAGETGKAKEIDEQLAALWKSQPPAKLAALALSETERAVLIGYGKTPISDGARAVRELDLDQAAANLSLAISLGFKDLPRLRESRECWALLGRAELQSLIKNLEAPH